jgi:hypothetical protein
MTAMIVHDRRLLGFTPRGYAFSFIVDRQTRLAEIIGMVRANGRTRRIDTLHIFCHGLAARADLGQQMSTSERHGGFGLELGNEGLTLETVARTHAWRGLVGQIVLFACHPAETSGGNAGTRGDGRRFCGELCLWTGAEVIGARDEQRYAHIEQDFWSTYVFDSTPLDFGAWEGPVYRFTPDRPEGVVFTPRPHDPLRPLVY